MQLIKPRQISGEIMTLIEEADEKVIIISPYFKLKGWYKMQNILNSLKSRRIDVEIYVREGEHETIREVCDAGFEPITIPHLHTKLYLNEKMAIVSSMNLLYSSDMNSLDIALKTESEKEYDELFEYYKRYVGKVAAEAVYEAYDWRGDLEGHLAQLLDRRITIYEQSNKLTINGKNRYDVFIEHGNELCIVGILSNKEYDFAKTNLDVIACKNQRVECREGGKGRYDTIWGISSNLKTTSIHELHPTDAHIIVQNIIEFITAVEKLKTTVRHDVNFSIKK